MKKILRKHYPFGYKIDISLWYEELSVVIGIPIPEIQEYIVRKYSAIPNSPFSNKQEILEMMPWGITDKDYWPSVNTMFFQSMWSHHKSDWLTQEYIDKQTPEDKHGLSILNRTIQQIVENTGFSRAEILKNIGTKDNDYLYWMWRIYATDMKDINWSREYIKIVKYRIEQESELQK